MLMTTFNFMTQIRHWLRWLRCFTRLHIKIHSLVTSLTLRRYIKNRVITDCTDYADIQGSTKNKFITEFADCLVFNTRWELRLRSDYADIHDNTQNSFITDYTDYADFREHIKSNVTTDYADYREFRDYIEK